MNSNFLSAKKLTIALCGALMVLFLIFAENWAKNTFKPLEFNPNFKKRIIHVKPDIICVGNSMLGSNIDQKTFEAELSKRAGRPIKSLFIITGGVHTAWQYLMLKNHIAPVAKKGKPILFFNYEDYYLRPDANTQAIGRTEKIYRRNMTGDEALFLTKIGQNSIYYKNGFPYLYSQRFRIKRWITSKFAFYFLKATGVAGDIKSRFFKRDSEEAIQWMLGTIFKGSNFRAGMVDDRERIDRFLFTGKSEQDFMAQADKSFLPDILSYNNKYKIILIQSNTNPSMRLIKSTVGTYSERLEKYVTSKGGILIDMNRVKAVQRQGLMHDSRHFTRGIPRKVNTTELVKELEKKSIVELLKR